MNPREKIKQHCKDHTDFKWQHKVCPIPGPVYTPCGNAYNEDMCLRKRDGRWAFSPAACPISLLQGSHQLHTGNELFLVGWDPHQGNSGSRRSTTGVRQASRLSVINYSVLERNLRRFQDKDNSCFLCCQEFESRFFVHVLMAFTNLTIKLLSVCVCTSVCAYMYTPDFELSPGNIPKNSQKDRQMTTRPGCD